MRKREIEGEREGEKQEEWKIVDFLKVFFLNKYPASDVDVPNSQTRPNDHRREAVHSFRFSDEFSIKKVNQKRVDVRERDVRERQWGGFL